MLVTRVSGCVQEPSPFVGELHGVEDLEASVGAHGGADLEERAGQLVGSSDEHEGDVAGASVDSLLVDGVEEGVLDVFVWDVVLAGAVCVVDGNAIIVVQNWGGVMLWCRQALIPLECR